MGSVKDLDIRKSPVETTPGSGQFIFSDRYSVFDWGEMPDHIPHKGEALCLMTSYFFEKLEKMGIKTHYQGVVEEGEIKKLDEINSPVNTMEVSLVRVIEPEYKNGEYNYSAYQDQNLANVLIPLEIIYRNTLPQHSSFRRRVNNGELDIKDYGLEELPPPGIELEQPIYDVSTKLEASDRYISWGEARKIAGLNDSELDKIMNLLEKVNQLISQEVEKAGFKNLDGKIELAFDENRNIMVVDAVGTPDECRFAHNNFTISKEAIRKYYRNTEWHREVMEAKKSGKPEWKNLVDTSPEPLPENILKLISHLYMVCANQVTGKKWYKDILSLTEIENKLKNIDEI
ncbi:MAG: phosphoribosylaminoimidazolesuccinocarboxamide synthase [Bacillota bacterium]